MNNYVAKQIGKALSKNNNANYIDVYNANPLQEDICCTLTTNSGSLGGSGSIATIERKN